MDSYETFLQELTKGVNSQIKNAEMFKKFKKDYISQYQDIYDIQVAEDRFLFYTRGRHTLPYNVLYSVLKKNVLGVFDNQLLTYEEIREFNRVLHLVKLSIVLELKYEERITINAEKKAYGVLFSSLQEKADAYNYFTNFARIPTILLKNFNEIPFGDVFLGCNSKTIQFFEDYYSGILAPRILKK